MGCGASNQTLDESTDLIPLSAITQAATSITAPGPIVFNPLRALPAADTADAPMRLLDPNEVDVHRGQDQNFRRRHTRADERSPRSSRSISVARGSHSIHDWSYSSGDGGEFAQSPVIVASDRRPPRSRSRSPVNAASTRISTASLRGSSRSLSRDAQRSASEHHLPPPSTFVMTSFARHDEDERVGRMMDSMLELWFHPPQQPQPTQPHQQQ